MSAKLLKNPEDVYSLSRGDKINVLSENSDYLGEWTCLTPGVKLSSGVNTVELIQERERKIRSINVDSGIVKVLENKLELKTFPRIEILSETFYNYSELRDVLNQGEKNE